jgi:PAS domain-containing protein
MDRNAARAATRACSKRLRRGAAAVAVADADGRLIAVNPAFCELAGRRRGYQMEKRYYHADGRPIWVMLFVSLVRDAGGRPLYFISQIEDITERKRTASAVRS